MIYGIFKDDKIKALKGLKSFCPLCNGELTPKCGDVNIWHWAHKHKSFDCDIKPETEWHREWKSYFTSENCEVVIKKNGVKKIADFVFNNIVFEFQHSPISPKEIKLRESFYGNMIWIFDAIEPYSYGRLLIRPKENYVTFRWKHAKRTLGFCSKRIFLDIGYNELIEIKKIYTEAPVGGWGKVFKKHDIIEKLGGKSC
jgi:hypothetical protein